MTSLVDTHVHLDDPRFEADRATVITAAHDAGVREMIHIGYRPDRWDAALALVAEHDGVSCALGVHPGNAADAVDDDLDRLADLASRAGVVAIGEIGLDLYWTTETIGCQLAWFRRQLELATALNMPVIIHQRSAATDVYQELSEIDPSLPVVLHSFDGDGALARLALERGYLIGVGGLMTRAASTELRDVLRRIPIDQIVLETDAPYLVPTGTKTHRNSPALLPVIAARLAELRGISVEEVANRTTAAASSVLLNARASHLIGDGR